MFVELKNIQVMLIFNVVFPVSVDIEHRDFLISTGQFAYLKAVLIKILNLEFKNISRTFYQISPISLSMLELTKKCVSWRKNLISLESIGKRKLSCNLMKFWLGVYKCNVMLFKMEHVGNEGTMTSRKSKIVKVFSVERTRNFFEQRSKSMKFCLKIKRVNKKP